MARYISAVQYGENYKGNKVIEKVKVHCDEYGIFPSMPWSREQVITELKNGVTIKTLVRAPSGRFVIGADVQKVKINNTEYIRTDGNKTESDNLGELPSF